jgi:hypothetical protein
MLEPTTLFKQFIDRMVELTPSAVMLPDKPVSDKGNQSHRLLIRKVDNAAFKMFETFVLDEQLRAGIQFGYQLTKDGTALVVYGFAPAEVGA